MDQIKNAFLFSFFDHDKLIDYKYPSFSTSFSFVMDSPPISKLTYHVTIALFLSIFALSSLILTTPILFSTINDIELTLESERISYERLANEIWNDLYDSDDVDKKRIVRESIDERSPRKCRDASCGVALEFAPVETEKTDHHVERRQYTVDQGKSFNAVGESNYNPPPPPPRVSAPKKEQCPVGPPGTPGPDGIPGIPGQDGLNGKSGATPASYSNPQSSRSCDESCPPGPSGLPGYKGKRGARGPLGPNGGPGYAGQDGMMGDNGPDGDIGMPGPVGLPGQQGVPGEDGMGFGRGSPGPKGEPGMMGMEGDEGYPGDRGDDALPGEPGEKGPAGSPGLNGRDGRPGLPGKDGRLGKDAEYCPCPEKNNQKPEFQPKEEYHKTEEVDEYGNHEASPTIPPTPPPVKVQPSTYPPVEVSRDESPSTYPPKDEHQQVNQPGQPPPGYERFAHIETSQYKSRSQRTSKNDFARSLRRRLGKKNHAESNVEGSGEDPLPKTHVKPRSSSSTKCDEEKESKKKRDNEDLIVDSHYRLL